MKNQILVSFPETLAFSLNMENQEFKREIKKMSLIKLYELGKISSGRASELLNISCVDFLEMIGNYQVSYFQDYTKDELETDYKNA